jgi:PKHD-type hydroxylase
VLVEYGVGGFYNWHLDAGPAAPTRKLSVSVALSDPAAYAGGGLSFPGREVAGVARGSAVVFPSFLLHAVQPVTSGRRHALLAWAGGPRFR